MAVSLKFESSRSVFTIKLVCNEAAHQFQPNKELKTAKLATKDYNLTYSLKN